MTPETLREAGEALYGALWQSALARDLGINERTMRRWVAGDNAIPESIRSEILGMVRQRAATLNRIAMSLEAA